MDAVASIIRASRTEPATDPQRLAGGIVLLYAALALPTLLAAALDPRTIDGVGVWVKPLKFELAFALHWLTLAWLVPLVAATSRPALACWLRIGSVATGVELAVIGLQAARGRASHFNSATALDAFLYYGVMACAVLLILAATLAMAWLLWRDPADPQRGPAWLGAVLGLGLGATFTLLVTAPLAAGLIDGPGPRVGGIKSNAAGLPALHWSTSGGDLRVPHFMATHVTQVLPALGWLLLEQPSRSVRHWLWLVAAAAVALVALTAAQAIRGQPLWPARAVGEDVGAGATAVAPMILGAKSSLDRKSDGATL